MKKFINYAVFVFIGICILLLWFNTWHNHKILNEVELGSKAMLGDSFGALNALFSGLAFAGVLFSINIQIRATKADHKRRKQEATINYVNNIRPVYSEMLREYKKENGKGALSNEALRKVIKREDDNLGYEVKDFLGCIEHLAIGAHEGVFDKGILYRMFCNYLIDNYTRFQPYIKHRQQKYATAYTEFHELVLEFETAKVKLPVNKNSGNYFS